MPNPDATQPNSQLAEDLAWELRLALREYGRHKDDCTGDFPLLDLHCNCGLEALLTQPVAGEGGKVRLEMAVVRRDEVIDIAKDGWQSGSQFGRKRNDPAGH